MAYENIENIIVFDCINVEKHITDWNTYKINIIRNLNNINFQKNIEKYIPCKRKLYLTRPKMRMILHFRIQQLNENIFQEVGHEHYEPKKEYNISWHEMCEFIEECVKILVKKQQCK